jgi:hypothetical protein
MGHKKLTTHKDDMLLTRLIHEGAMSGGGRGEIGPKMLVAG